ncbi:SGNH/GDSL hydrolase family protein [Companilactobacillus furfuricola]|uniref:SGNH/GDSL hydrolase family protein n=1 Tax=Companilactobacillus furfuricola TaxID=1462575 RepID=UPI000F77AE12|nr:SGNH/GDSL hydrolase family protein [Companilactobacillus furfuricola]
MGKKKKLWLMTWLCLGFFLVFASGCSQSKPKTESSPKTEQKQKPKKTKKSFKTLATELKASSKKTLVYSPLGDSLSVGLMANSQTDRFTSQFARQISKATGKKVEEKGASMVGKTATNFGLPNIQTIIDQDPDIVTVEFGTNDAADVNNEQALPNYRSSIQQILDQLQAKTHAKIILVTSWSPADGPYRENDLRFDKVLKAEGKSRNLPVVNLAKIWQGDPSVAGTPASITESVWGRPADKLHPNQKGHDKIAQALTKVLNQPIDNK